MQLLHGYCPFSCILFNCSGHNYSFPCSLEVFDRHRKLQPSCNLRLNDLIPKPLSWMMAQQPGHSTGFCVSLISVLACLRIVSQSHFQQKLLVLLVVCLQSAAERPVTGLQIVCICLCWKSTRTPGRTEPKARALGATKRRGPGESQVHRAS